MRATLAKLNAVLLSVTRYRNCVTTRLSGTLDASWKLSDRRRVREFVAGIPPGFAGWLLALFVTAKLDLIAVASLARGAVGEVAIDLPGVTREGRARDARAFLLVHVLPGDLPRLSERDYRRTRTIRALAEDGENPLLDHLLVTSDDLLAIGWGEAGGLSPAGDHQTIS